MGKEEGWKKTETDKYKHTPVVTSQGHTVQSTLETIWISSRRRII